jgi:hypothetical protein
MMASDAYAYCVRKADEHGLAAEPIAGFCRARLQLHSPAPAEAETRSE